MNKRGAAKVKQAGILGIITLWYKHSQFNH
jgi:hypothetical protein